MNVVQRPSPRKQKINTKDDFELCYLRHQYLRRSAHNPSEGEIAPYLPIIQNQARKTFVINASLFISIGMDIECIVNIGRVHATSFLNLFTMEKQPEKMEKFIDTHVKKKGREPDLFDVGEKNKANFTYFIKQRYEDLVRICKQKVRNVDGVASEDFVAFSGKEPPRYPHRLLKEFSQLGFRKLDPSVFRTIKKRARPNNPDFFQYNGLWFIVIRIEREKLTLDDLVASDISPLDPAHANDPETRFMACQEEDRFLSLKEKYESMSNEDKAKIIRDFLHKNENDNRFAPELRTAKRLLKGME